MVDLGITLPKEFLKEEVRCDYNVSREMKEIWAVELDLLSLLLEVCKKHGIEIFADGGTLLGAVRHRGFIPWDDDIDLVMARDQYEKLCHIAPDEFKEPYFFQTEYSDPGSLRGHAQLRNSNTTGILESEKEGRYSHNQGIFIDIFPLDAVIEDERLFRKQQREIKKYRLWAGRFSFLGVKYRKGSVRGIRRKLKQIVHFLFGNIIMKLRLEERAYKRFEKACQKYNGRETEMIGQLSFNCEDNRLVQYRKDFQEIINMPFEFMQVPVCREYHRVLCRQYGDYMRFERGGSYHGGVLFDTDKPYTEYL